MTPSKLGSNGKAILSPTGALNSLQGLNSINLNSGIVQNSKTPKEQYKRNSSLPVGPSGHSSHIEKNSRNNSQIPGDDRLNMSVEIA